jgi:phosphoglycolate phosphatase
MTNRLVVFDCDGTLVDGQHAIFAAMTEAFGDHRIAPPPPAAVRRVVGLPLAEAVQRLVPEADSARVAALAQAYRDSFLRLRQSPGHYEPLFPGVVETLDGLLEKGFLLAVATGKSRQGLSATLERHDLLRRFTILKTSDDGPGKPSPHMLICAMSDAGAEPGSTVMVGDTVFDMEMARSAKVPAVGVGWGYHEGAELEAAGAAAVVREFGELPALIERLIGRT